MDMLTLNEICANINNYFDSGAAFSGTFTIADGKILEPLEISEGQYVRIIGSALNDGAYRYNDGNLQDEQFKGRITVMRLPMDFQSLVNEIAEWKKTNAKYINGVLASESFGGYSYTLDTANGRATLQGVFGSRLNRYRKI